MMNDANSQKERAVLLDQLVEVDQLYLNVSQRVIVTTEDKIKLCLGKHFKNVEKKREWLTPLSLLVTIIIVFATSNFKAYILSAATWEAIFVILGIVCFAWFILTIKNAFQNIKIENIIDELKLGDKQK